jgi:DNA-directed RNA polymerase specialized sigma24 family protein
MYDLEGRPVQEVAQALGRSPGAVYMLRARAHRRLSEIMGTASRYVTDSP